MSYWDLGAHGAANYSRDVEKASEAVRRAKSDLLEALRTAYPKDARVRVMHYRGSFMGSVAGWDADGSRVAVLNDKSGKVGRWWSAHVELAGVAS
ncbi:hypothetical protein J2W24_002670 [Variovorax boronicumulans]|uniref:hypothetical protein n=1 Tax=Variovorax boronicumulans TaxID=436515 RepID=UPI00277D2C7D|nr:hypothetical protein [Variovorax boronicumulans]MDP9917019.1 hypothetical protein [Variovorax boronicumulans]